MAKSLTNLTNPARHRLWAELTEDSRLASLRFATLGWVPRKQERVRGVQDKFAVCVLRAGAKGDFRDEATGEIRPVRGPGVFFVSPGGDQDYGPASARDRWDEFYWIVEGGRVVEWPRVGWWDRVACFHPVPPKVAAEGWRLFKGACAALERRDRRALDLVKLAFEGWLSTGPWVDAARPPAPASPVAAVVETWRRDLARAWSLPGSARAAGLSYTRFRARFAKEYGQGPYGHLLRLRMELARRWLRSTDEPVKAVALRCGFRSVEPFIRAFAKAHGLPPGRWRAKESAGTRDRIPEK